MVPIVQYLEANGPSRSSVISQHLQETHGISAEAARQRIFRCSKPIEHISGLLPKNERFLYLESQYEEEAYWKNLVIALRQTGSTYAAALDGILARGGMIPTEDFATISGAPITEKRNISHARVLAELRSVRLVFATEPDAIMVNYVYCPTVNSASEMHALRKAELVQVEALKNWLKNVGLVSYDKVAARGSEETRMVGPYSFDITAPSYLHPLTDWTRSKPKPGFVVADVFANKVINENQVQFFLKKVAGIAAFKNIGKIMPILLAPGFTAKALSLGKEKGILFTTPANLFGTRAGESLSELTRTIKNAAAVVTKNPEKLESLVEGLSDIEGRNLNLRGILFELFSAYLLRDKGRWLEMGVIAGDGQGRSAEIDILQHIDREHLLGVECKGKSPGGSLSKNEVEKWIKKIPVWEKHIRSDKLYREASLSFQIWTSGAIDEDALELLEATKANRKRISISWLDGDGFRKKALSEKEGHIRKSFDEHFFRHPVKRWAAE